MARVTVEDCLERVPSRFALVIVAARRTRELLKGSEAQVHSKNKAAVTSLREIASGAIYVEEDVTQMLEQYIESHPTFGT